MISPHSVYAEQGLLGLIMLDNSNYELVKGQLPPDEFYIPMYQALYKAIEVIIGSGMEANPITLSEKLSNDVWGDATKLNSDFNLIFDSASRSMSATSLAYVISQRAHERRMIEAAKLLTQAVEGNDADKAKEMQLHISQLMQTFSNVRPENPLEQLRKSFEAAKVGGLMMKTNVRGWDDAFGGLFKGSRYIIAGHGGIGKSAFTINLAWNMAVAGKKVRWISFEEKPEAIWWRIQSRFGKVSVSHFREGLDEKEQTQIMTVQEKLIGPDFLAYENICTVGQIIQTCGNCDLVVIDGITSWPLPQAESKVEKAGIVTEYAKTIADRTGATVIMLSHVNGDGIKNGASITGLYGGQAATFDPEAIVELRFAEKEVPNGVMEREVKMFVIKNRYGPPNITKSFMYNGRHQTYRDLI